MLNWADLSRLLVTASGLLGGFAVAGEHRTGWVAGILFALGGLAVGFGLGIISSFASHRVLETGMKASEKCQRGGFTLELLTPVIYLVSPMPFILASFGAPMGVALLIYSLRSY